MRSEVVFKGRKKPLIGEVVGHTDAYIDLRHVDRDGKFRCTRIELTEIREVRNLLFDLPPANEAKRARA
jgi:hypothetical protein